MSSLSKKDLSGVISQVVGLNKSESKELVEFFLNHLMRFLAQGNRLSFLDLVTSY